MIAALDRIAVIVAAALAAAGGGCSVDPLSPEGRPCSPTVPCGPGARCDPSLGRCVALGGDGAPECGTGQARCGGACVDTSSSMQHCGGCGRSCAGTGDRCVGGQCRCGAGSACGAGLDCVGGACRCIAGGRCTGCCAGGACVPPAQQSLERCGVGGAACAGCDDAISCTADSCTADQGCRNALRAKTCLIQGVCVAEGTVDPANPCQRCESANSALGYTFHLAKGCVTTLAGRGPWAAGLVDGPAATAQFHSPDSVAVTKDGKTVYVADTVNNAIRVVAGGMVSTLAGGGNAGHKDGPAVSARFNGPQAVARGPKGAVYVADTGNNCIRKIAGGKVTTLAGVASIAGGFADGAAASALFATPSGLCVDSAGAVYVADMHNYRIRKIAGGKVSTFAGSGLLGYADGPVGTARFASPMTVALGPTGALFVAEVYRVRKIAGGTVSTVAGGTAVGYVDGPAAAARFELLDGIAVSPKGVVYVAEEVANTIRAISGGTVSTVAGVRGSFSHADGPAAKAHFNGPAGLSMDGAGKIYIADRLGSRIRLYWP